LSRNNRIRQSAHKQNLQILQKFQTFWMDLVCRPAAQKGAAGQHLQVPVPRKIGAIVESMAHITTDHLLLQSNYNGFTSTLGAAGLMLGIAIAGVLFGGGGLTELGWTLVFLGGFWGILVLIFGAGDWLRVRRERADALALFSGGAWAEWRWSMAEWGAELARRRDLHARQVRFQRYTPLLGIVAGLIIGGCALLPVIFGGTEIPAQARTFIIGLAIFFFCLSVILSVSGVWRERRRWEHFLARAESLAAPAIRFGPNGYYHEADGHTSLRRLDGVSYSAKKAELAFFIRHSGPRGSSFRMPVTIPVPAAHAGEAAALAARYRAERGLGS
jgi:hypothetical protein